MSKRGETHCRKRQQESVATTDLCCTLPSCAKAVTHHEETKGYVNKRGYDVIAQAQSGTGKTVTFAISILQQIELDLKAIQALVLAPTRELAQQIQKVVMALGDYMGASCHACIGGTNVRAEVQKLQMEAPHIIVGTPGQVFDMLNRRYLSPKYIKMFVLDEADTMLSRGFKDQIYDIFQKLNSNTDSFVVHYNAL
ncbi:hypothetical protein STEG23_037062 [Scotinomys teguina]